MILVSRFPWTSFNRPDIHVIDIFIKSPNKEDAISILSERLKKSENFTRLCVDVAWNQWQNLFHLTKFIQKIDFLLNGIKNSNKENGKNVNVNENHDIKSNGKRNSFTPVKDNCKNHSSSPNHPLNRKNEKFIDNEDCDLTGKFIKNQGLIKNILSGMNALKCQELLIADLTLIQSFLLMAAFIASRNTIKHDLLVFSRGKRFNKGRKKGPKPKKKKKSQKSIKIKSFALDRLLAIFIFIFPNRSNEGGMPSQPIILTTLTELVKRGLLGKSSHPDRINNIKFKCILKFEIIEAIAKRNNFIIEHYFTKEA